MLDIFGGMGIHHHPSDTDNSVPLDLANTRISIVGGNCRGGG